MELMKFSNVSKSYQQGNIFSKHKKITALQNINLTLMQGQATILVGASGSGKSTLGRLALGIEKPEQGEIFYKGKLLASMSKEELKIFRKSVQVVFQNSHAAVNPRFTAQKIIAEPLTNYTSLKNEALNQKIIQLLQQVGLSEKELYKYPHQLSGGELQRICIARAIALSPELIILDEAVSSLDVLNQGKILELLLHIQQETKTTFLFITHDLRIAGKFANAMAIMENGHIVSYTHNINDPSSRQELYSTPSFQKLVHAIYPPLPPTV